MTRDTRAFTTAAIVAVCASVATVVAVFGVRLGERNVVQHARHEATVAAQRAARDVLSYDYRTIDTDIARSKRLTTGLFAREYAQSADALAEQARQTRAIVQATPGLPGVVTATADEVVVLLFVDQVSVKQLPGARKPASRIDQSRVRLTMTRVGDRWLVSQLSAL